MGKWDSKLGPEWCYDGSWLKLQFISIDNMAIVRKLEQNIFTRIIKKISGIMWFDIDGNDQLWSR